MEVKSLQCDICGGQLAMESGGKTAICKACGMEYSLERIQEKVQEIRGIVKIDGAIDVKGIRTKNDLLNNAKTLVKLGEYDGAKCVYWDIVKQYPEEGDAWWGLFELEMSNEVNEDKFFRTVPGIISRLHFGEKYYQRAMKLGDYKREYQILLDSVMNYGHLTLEGRDITSVCRSVLRLTDEDCVKYPELKFYRNQMTKEYIEAFRMGKVSFFQDFPFDNINKYASFLALLKEGEANASMINEKNQYSFIGALESHIVRHGSGFVPMNCRLQFCDCDRLYLYSLYHEYDGITYFQYNDKSPLDMNQIYNIVFFVGSTLIVRSLDMFERNEKWQSARTLSCKILELDQPFEISQIKSKVGINWKISINDEEFVTELIAPKRDTFHQAYYEIENNRNKYCSNCGIKYSFSLFGGAKCPRCGSKKV